MYQEPEIDNSGYSEQEFDEEYGIDEAQEELGRNVVDGFAGLDEGGSPEVFDEEASPDEPAEDGSLEEMDEDGSLEEPDPAPYDEGNEEDELSDEELDKIADTAIEVLQDILGHFDAAGAEINEYEGDDGELILDVAGGDLAILIGRRGKTLEALQTLVSSITHHKMGFKCPITIDVESYKHRQRQKIESLAASAASRACRQDRSVKLRPMNPYERRLVHLTLRDDERVETFSEGVDPHRYVVVKPL